MRIYRCHGSLVIESRLIIQLTGFAMARRNGYHSAKAAAFFPFVFVKSEEFATPIFINHERIHFRQQIETLFIGSWILILMEDIYSRVFLKLELLDYYLYRAGEQEAYCNQHNFNYLKNRLWFSLFTYLRNKRKLTFIPNRPPEVIVGDLL